jgi:hypothetical protein
VYVRTHRLNGWHRPNTYPANLSPDAALFRALMDMGDNPGQERMRFLGG